MSSSKRRLSQGSVDADGPPLQRRRSSITQGGTIQGEESDDSSVVTPYRENQSAPSASRPSLYYQPSSNGPIFNGDIYGKVENNVQVATFDALQFLYQHAAMGAVHESNERYPPQLCYPGTRDVVVGRVIGWYFSKDGQKKILWVHAPLGYGKTAVAGTVKEKLDVMELDFESPVGATFFFWRSSPERNSPAHFIITLAYQLAQSIPELRPHVDAVIKSKPGIVKLALELQLDELIVKPFKSLKSLQKMPNRLIIVDGIDECINSDEVSCVEKKYAEDQEVAQIRVLNLIRRLYSHHLPFSFLILSRPEAWIKRHLGSPRFRDVVEPLDLYEVGDHMGDVKRFVRAELSRIATSFGYRGVEEEWTDEQALVQKSEGHMVYAATVIRHIDDEYADPRALLTGIVKSSASTRSTSHSTPLSSLYELYRQIMRSCPERNRSVMTSVLEEVMMLTRDSLALRDNAHEAALRVLDVASGRLPGDGLRALRPLHAVLRIGNGNVNTGIDELFIHSSFPEFLEDPQISFEFSVDICKGRERVLSNVLDRMTSITTNTIGNKLEEADIFALCQWCDLWWNAKDTFSRKTHINMIKKISALDLTACIIQYYLHSIEWMLYPGFDRLLDCSPQSEFFVPSRQSGGCPDIPSVVHMVTSHTQASLDHAFTLLLKESIVPAFPADVLRRTASDCARYLKRVTSQPDWREHKLVQALGHPGPNGISLFEKVVDCLCEDHVLCSQRVCDLLDHIYKVMVQEKNPIVEAEDHPFREFLELTAEEGWELNSSDLSSDSNEE